MSGEMETKGIGVHRCKQVAVKDHITRLLVAAVALASLGALSPRAAGAAGTTTRLVGAG